MATKRDFDIIRRYTYDGEYLKALKLLVNIVQQQEKQIESLQDKLAQYEKTSNSQGG